MVVEHRLVAAMLVAVEIAVEMVMPRVRGFSNSNCVPSYCTQAMIARSPGFSGQTPFFVITFAVKALTCSVGAAAVLVATGVKQKFRPLREVAAGEKVTICACAEPVAVSALLLAASCTGTQGIGNRVLLLATQFADTGKLVTRKP